MSYWLMIPFSFSGGDHDTDIVVLLLTRSVKLSGVDGSVLAKETQTIYAINTVEIIQHKLK